MSFPFWTRFSWPADATKVIPPPISARIAIEPIIIDRKFIRSIMNSVMFAFWFWPFIVRYWLTLNVSGTLFSVVVELVLFVCDAVEESFFGCCASVTIGNCIEIISVRSIVVSFLCIFCF